MLVLNELPSKELFEQAATELAIDPAMVEKDWYVTQILALMANLDLSGYTIVFSGGTSLSYGMDSNVPDFGDAMDSVRRLIAFILVTGEWQ